MTPTVEVVDQVGLGAVERPVADLVQGVLEAEGAHGQLVVAFVDEQTVAGLNRRYRGLDEPTDVLSFPDAGESGAWSSGDDLGELVVCPTVVSRYAREDGRPGSIQLGWTLIHGSLHLLGYDHEADHGEMRRREAELLAALAPLVQALPLLAQTGTP